MDVSIREFLVRNTECIFSPKRVTHNSWNFHFSPQQPLLESIHNTCIVDSTAESNHHTYNGLKKVTSSLPQLSSRGRLYVPSPQCGSTLWGLQLTDTARATLRRSVSPPPLLRQSLQESLAAIEEVQPP